VSALAAALMWAAQAASPPPPSPPPLGPEPLSYPLPLAEPDFTAPGTPFKLVDLRYELSDTFSTDHAFLARLRVRDWGFLGASSRGEERALTLETARTFVSAGGREGVYTLGAGYRASRFELLASAERITARGARGWRLDPFLAVRLSPDLELLGALVGDTRRRFLRSATLGLLWQRGARWEAFGEYAHARESTAAGFENTRDSGLLSLVGQLGPAELSGGGRIDDTRGRFPHRQLEPDLGLRLSLAPRLLLEGGARARLERGAGQRSHHYDGALTWFGRRFTLPRAGAAAQRSVALARRAAELGYYERRAFDDDGRRRQRERLSLADEREALLDDLVALYREQVRERAVPLLGLEVVDEGDDLTATQARIVRVLLGVPWPPDWPWRSNEDAVPFLRLDLERERGLSGPGFRTISDTVTLTAFLNREMELRVSWGRTPSTPLDLIRGIGERRTFELSYLYAFGR
jgi:hypothetical protein